ncbi:MAG: hypothetical protein WDW38_002012 [Sanguina aurantia]
MSKPLSRAAWESLHALRHASASAAATSRFSTQLQPICSSEHPSQDYGRVLVTDAAEGVEYKGLFDRNLPLGPYEVLLSLQLKKDMQVTHDPWENPADERKFSLAQHASNSMAPDASSVSTAYSTVTADEESGGLEVKWHAHSDEPGRTLRADPLEWFRHHTSRLENESRGRTPAPLPETQFLRQLTSEHMSRDAALTDYKKMRESAEKRGELGELVPVRNLMRSWMPALEQAIANEQMLYQRNGATESKEVTRQELERAQYGPYLMLLEPHELSKLTIQAVLLTSTMTDLKRRQKAKIVSKVGQCATATSVVLAIGQRVQDIASFHAMTASIQEKQKAFVSDRRHTAMLDQQATLRAAAGGGPHEAPAPAESPELTGYKNSTELVSARVGHAAAPGGDAGPDPRVECARGCSSVGLMPHVNGSSPLGMGGVHSAGAAPGRGRACLALGTNQGTSCSLRLSQPCRSAGGASLPAAERGRKVSHKLKMMKLAAADFRRGASSTRNGNLQKQTLKHLEMAADVQSWDQMTRARIGAALLTLMLDTAKIYNPDTRGMEAAFSHAIEFDSETRQTVGRIRAHERTVFNLEDDDELRRGLTPKYMPMVVEPRPWTGTKTGGYLSLDEKVMKVRSSDSLWRKMRLAEDAGELQNLCDALTVIGNVPWRINREVYQVMQQLWSSSAVAIVGLPSKTPERPPLKVTSLCKATPGSTPNLRLVRTTMKGNGQLLVTAGPLTGGELHRHILKTKEASGANINAASQRNEFLLKLQVAEQFLDEPCIYYPHQVDFRGRAYTLHPHLQHLGDDVCRGLLKFSEGKVLGQRGLYWLKVQIANVYGKGKDKLSFDDRVAWTETQLEHVVDSATEPLTGQQWWMQGEKPWQLLATCTELYAALSGDPETFVSHISVHQDGSCNGLQHYAALGRDLEGGKSVNLVPSVQPQDVYKGVAQRVQERVASDAAEGNKLAITLLARGTIDRGMVKQTVMTSVYGVTYIGAREQIKGKLQERGFTQAEELRQMTAYLTPIVIEKMGQVFSSARDIMKWLADCARIVASLDKPMTWRSPLGFPIEQPYRKEHTESVQTGLQAFTLATTKDDGTLSVSRRQQRSSFPPNFIHSLDSAHMMMTAMACREEGMAFAGVHDSYWTHACDVDKMNILLREKFVELHGLPLMEYLVDDIQKSLTDEDRAKLEKAKIYFGEPPQLGELDLNLVRQSTYFFS